MLSQYKDLKKGGFEYSSLLISNLMVVEMASDFDPFVESGPLRQHAMLQQFFESFLSLARDPEALVKIEKFLYH